LALPKIVVAALSVLWLRILRHVAPSVLVKRAKSMQGPNGRMEIKSIDDIAFIGSMDNLKGMTGNLIKNALKEAQEGSPAPNPEVLDLLSRKSMKLLDWEKNGRPLVLNFGSCT